MKKIKGLGRGLEALLGPTVNDGGDVLLFTATNSLPLDELVPGQYQPRTRMDEGALYELAESIRAQGIMQPILVRPLINGPNKGKFEIIAGERRFRAAKIAGLNEIPVLVKPVPDESAAAMALIENIQREDLNALEEAQGLHRLIEEFDFTHEQAAQAVGRSRSAASNILRLLNLTPPVQALLMAGDLEMGHARALLSLKSADQITAANQIVSKNFSVRESELLVKRFLSESSLKSPNKSRKEKSGDHRLMEENLSDIFTADIEIRIKKRVKRGDRMDELGELVIEFNSTDELNTLIERLLKSKPIQV
jgi:ParB family transcriptional regulator, chromosome partitioning protein